MESIKKCGTCKYANISLQDYPCRVCNLGNGECDCWESSEPIGATAMTRSECESAIMEHAKAIRDIYRQYRGDARFLSMSIVNEHISIYNSHWADGGDADRPIDVYLGEGDE